MIHAVDDLRTYFSEGVGSMANALEGNGSVESVIMCTCTVAEKVAKGHNEEKHKSLWVGASPRLMEIKEEMNRNEEEVYIEEAEIFGKLYLPLLDGYKREELEVLDSLVSALYYQKTDAGYQALVSVYFNNCLEAGLPTLFSVIDKLEIPRKGNRIIGNTGLNRLIAGNVSSDFQSEKINGALPQSRLSKIKHCLQKLGKRK